MVGRASAVEENKEGYEGRSASHSSVIVWSGNSSLGNWHLSKDLKEVNE